jgi:hypothetical protein
LASTMNERIQPPIVHRRCLRALSDTDHSRARNPIAIHYGNHNAAHLRTTG